MNVGLQQKRHVTWSGLCAESDCASAGGAWPTGSSTDCVTGVVDLGPDYQI